MAASVIRTLSTLGLEKPFPPCFSSAEDEEETEEEYEEDHREDEDDEQNDDVIGDSGSFPEEGMTIQLLHFAEVISNDVQRYFGPSQDPDSCDIYAERPLIKVSGRQRYYADFVRVASSGAQEEPELPGPSTEPLGPLAELFQGSRGKEGGLPMSQRRLPLSFWTEPLVLGHRDAHETSSETEMLSFSDVFSSSCSSSAITPDFSDLLAHWATDRDNPSEFSCDFQIS